MSQPWITRREDDKYAFLGFVRDDRGRLVPPRPQLSALPAPEPRPRRDSLTIFRSILRNQVRLDEPVVAQFAELAGVVGPAKACEVARACRAFAAGAFVGEEG